MKHFLNCLTLFSFLSSGIQYRSSGVNNHLIVRCSFLQPDTAIHDICLYAPEKIMMVSYGDGKIYRADCNKPHPVLMASLDSVYFEKIIFTSSQSGWLAGENSRLLHTKDGGSTWNRHSFDTGRISHLIYSMTWIGNDTGFLGTTNRTKPLKENYFFRTTDHGSTWSKLPAPDLFFDIVHGGGKILLATGNNSIYRSSDLGDHWQEIYRDEPGKIGQIRDLALINAKTWMAVAFSGFLVISENTGRTWRTVRISDGRLRSIASGKQKIIIAGDRNTSDLNTWISTNTGASWQSNMTGSSDIHKVIRFNKGFIAGGKDGIYVLPD